jgi:hypothetical protein
MSRTAIGVVYGVGLAGVIVAVDLLFFRDHPWPRLAANVGIALLVAASFFRFLRNSQASAPRSRRVPNGPTALGTQECRPEQLRFAADDVHRVVQVGEAPARPSFVGREEPVGSASSE